MLKVAKEENRYLVSLFQVNKINTLFSDLISKQLIRLVSISGRHIIFNLEGIRFIDTAGFQTLEQVADTADKNRTLFQLCNITDDVRELLDLTGMQEKLDIIPELEVQEKILMELDE
jgi:anti-anti-sigma factor